MLGRPIETVRQSAIGYRARQRIGGKGVGAVAEHIAWKLIEQDQQRQGALRVVLPGGEFASRCRLVCREKARDDLTIKGLIFLEPFVRPGVAPERDNLGGRGGYCHSPCRVTCRTACRINR